jgi:hypothetical protein
VVDTQNAEQWINDMFEGVQPESEVCPRRKIEIDNNISTIRREKIATCDDNYNMGF